MSQVRKADVLELMAALGFGSTASRHTHIVSLLNFAIVAARQSRAEVIRLRSELEAERALRLEVERTLELSAVGVALSVATRRRVDA